MRVISFTSIAAFTSHDSAGLGGAPTPISEVITDVLRRANADNSSQRIYTQILDARAAESVESLRPGPSTPLSGVPVAIKDNIDVEGTPTSCGRRLALGPAIASAAIVARLESLGAIIIGKTNLDEAALGASGRNPRFGRCGNPRFAECLSGGSSSGSTAAVASGHVLLGVGTDTLGSVRIPAAFCGIAGFKPSHGRLPMLGVAPLFPRFDSVGLLAATVADVAHVARLLLGDDASHARSLSAAYRVAVLDDAALAGVATEVARGHRHCVALLQESLELTGGAAPAIDWTATARAAFWEVAHDFAEQSAGRTPGYHALDDIEGELRGLLSRAAGRPAAQLAAGRALLEGSVAKLEHCLRHADALLTPTCPQSAPRIEEDPAQNIAAFTAPANVAGLPAVAWTQRLGAESTVSLQLIGRFGEDIRLLELASQVQRILDRCSAIEPPSA